MDDEEFKIGIANDVFKIAGENETKKEDTLDAIRDRIRESMDAAGLECESLNEALDTLAHIYDKPPMKETKSLVVVGMALNGAKGLLSEISDLFENLCVLVGKGYLDADVKDTFIEHANAMVDTLLVINSALAKATVAIEDDLAHEKRQK